VRVERGNLENCLTVHVVMFLFGHLISSRADLLIADLAKWVVGGVRAFTVKGSGMGAFPLR
jgi:hypothetical protein